ncbi:MAG: AAA family ATPase [Rhodocyclaceae bacterium]|nr:AAA family ATPase [Rhodocyclaceae bacterium]
MLELRFLGEFGVVRDGEAQALPPSKKTRALLAYLCMQGRRLRREQLCELLWEVPDDPRGSLRWSLSKLRRLLEDGEHERILADRTHVGFDVGGIAVDALGLQALAGSDLAQVTTDVLEQAAAEYSGNFLEGLEFPDFHVFHAWYIAERESATRAQTALLRELVRRLVAAPDRALRHARDLVCIAPYDEGARATLIRLLVAAQHIEEADRQVELGLRMLKEAGVQSLGALREARQGAVGAPAVTDVPRTSPGPVPMRRLSTAERQLVGRQAELEVLAAAWHAARAGRAGAILLRGEPGLGKSTLLGSMHRVRDEGALVLRASAFEMDQIRPFALWMDALRRALPEAVGQLFGEEIAQSRDTLLARLSDRITREAERQPLALLFDDVHWADESSIAALHHVLRLNRQLPVLAVLAARESELRDNVSLQQALRGLRRDGLLHELRLGPMADREIETLIRARTDSDDGARLSRECGGNPLLALELARAGAEGGGDAGGSLSELVRERLARFDLEAAEVLRWAAVLGPVVQVPALLRMSGLDDGVVSRALEEAESQAILVSAEAGLRFAHDLIARAIYSEISPVRRQIMHRKVASWLEQDESLELTRAADLAHHATLSGDAALAARAMVSAGKLCLRFFANDDAQSLARKGLQLAEDLPAAEQVRLAVELHDVLLWAAPLEDWQDEADRYTRLAERALDHGAPAHARQAYHMAAYVRWQHGQWTGAREQSLQSERVARSGGSREQIIGLAETAKCLVLLERDLSQADAMAMEAQARAQRGEFAHQAIPAALGMLRFYENRLDEAEELLKRARTLCKWAGDRVSEYQADEYLAMIDIQRGRFDDALRRCEDLVTLGNKLRDGSEGPFAQVLRGLCSFAMDDDASALDAALADLRIADAKHRLAYAQTRAAMFDCQRGRHDRGADRAREALECAEVLERGTEMLLAHAVLAQCCRSDGDLSKADAHVAAAARLQARGVATWADDIAARVIGLEHPQHG